MITNEGLGTELAWDIYSKLKLKGKIESHEVKEHEKFLNLSFHI